MLTQVGAEIHKDVVLEVGAGVLSRVGKPRAGFLAGVLGVHKVGLACAVALLKVRVQHEIGGLARHLLGEWLLLRLSRSLSLSRLSLGTGFVSLPVAFHSTGRAGCNGLKELYGLALGLASLLVKGQLAGGLERKGL